MQVLADDLMSLALADLAGRKKRGGPPPPPPAPAVGPDVAVVPVQTGPWASAQAEIDSLKSDSTIQVYAAPASKTCPTGFTMRTLRDGSSVCVRPAPGAPAGPLPDAALPTAPGGGSGSGSGSGGGGGGGGPSEGGGGGGAEGAAEGEEGAPKEPPPAPPTSRMPMIVPIGIAAVGIAGGIWWYMRKKAAAAAEATPTEQKETGK